MTAFQLGPITFIGEHGPGWGFTETDWFAPTPNKSPRVERPLRHGAFPSPPPVREGKAFTVRVNRFDDSLAEREAAQEQIAAVGADGLVLATFTSDSGTSWRWVTVEDVDVAPVSPGVNFLEGTVQLWASDPRRYESGEWLSTPPPSPGQGRVWPSVRPLVWPGGGSSGRVELVNAGRAPSAPVFRLHGGFDSAQITCVDTGSRVALARPVPVGSFVEIDFGTKRALLDGITDVSTWLRFREWVEVPGMQSRTFQFDAVSPVGAVMQGMVNHAWW